MTDVIQGELEALAAAREERAGLASRLRALETEREALERTVEQADADIDETTLDHALARLRSIERERSAAQQSLARLGDLDQRYALAIHRKYERVSGTSPDHPVLHAIAPLFERGHALRVELELSTTTSTARRTRNIICGYSAMFSTARTPLRRPTCSPRHCRGRSTLCSPSANID